MGGAVKSRHRDFASAATEPAGLSATGEFSLSKPALSTASELPDMSLPSSSNPRHVPHSGKKSPLRLAATAALYTVTPAA